MRSRPSAAATQPAMSGGLHTALAIAPIPLPKRPGPNDQAIAASIKKGIDYILTQANSPQLKVQPGGFMGASGKVR